MEDLRKWEENFRTHGELFRRQTIDGQYDHTMIEDGNRVILCADVSDVDRFFKVLDTRDAEDAKDFDGVNRETIEFFGPGQTVQSLVPNALARPGLNTHRAPKRETRWPPASGAGWRRNVDYLM